MKTRAKIVVACSVGALVFLTAGCAPSDSGPDDPGDSNQGDSDPGSGDSAPEGPSAAEQHGLCGAGEDLVHYDVNDLGTLREDNSGLANAIGINEAGDVVGVADSPNGSRGFLWQQGDERVQEIEGTALMYVVNARAINDQGEVAGQGMHKLSSGPGYMAMAYYWSEETDALPLAETDIYSFAHAINADGLVAGESGAGAAIWDGRSLETVFEGGLPGLPAFGTFNDINDDGVAVGTAQQEGASYHPVYWTSDDGMVILPGLGGTYGDARAINDDGQILAEVQNEHGFLRCALYDPDDYQAAPVDIGLLDDFFEIDGCAAEGLNNHGVAVGWDNSGVFPGIRSRAWVQFGDEKLDLTSLLTPEVQETWQLTTPVDINDHGVIVGIAIHDDIPGRAFVATPVCE